MKKIISFFILSIIFIGCSKDKAAISNSESAKTFHFNDTDIRYYEKIYFKSYGSRKNDKDFAELKIEYPELISSGVLSDSINKFIKNYLLDLPFNEDQYTSFDEIADSLFSNYISLQQEFDDYHIGWYINANSKINGVFKNIMSITCEEEIYTGGANTFYNLTYSNFNINSGKLITLESIINYNNIGTVEKIGEGLFRKLKDIPVNQPLKEAGFWFENKKFFLNDNFAITDSGLVFFYNLYEIAPRSEGTTKLFIPKEKLISYINIY
ncbi:MAG: RsiV family protein [Melioribacteraceae bacterium]|nr:RsiV family protein [Melioribacteraceae bacterium]